MTLLNGSSAPVLSPEDSFSLVYLGTYGTVVYNKERNENDIAVHKGPLPEGKYVWDGVDYLGGMEKGQRRLVPFDLVRIYFGDPRSLVTRQRFETRKGETGDIAPRSEETRRLSVLYGVYDTDAEKVKDLVPAVNITTADGVEVFCPAVDPQGNHVYGHISDSAENYDLATTIESMKMQIRLLEEQQKATEKKGTSNDGADVETDGPKRGTTQ
jgi:hypothetical protein